MFAACLCRHLQCGLISDYFPFFFPLYFLPLSLSSTAFLYRCSFFFLFFFFPKQARCRVARRPLLLFDCKRAPSLLCALRGPAPQFGQREDRCFFLARRRFFLSEGGKPASVCACLETEVSPACQSGLLQNQLGGCFILFDLI